MLLFVYSQAEGGSLLLNRLSLLVWHVSCNVNNAQFVSTMYYFSIHLSYHGGAWCLVKIQSKSILNVVECSRKAVLKHNLNILAYLETHAQLPANQNSLILCDSPWRRLVTIVQVSETIGHH